MATPTEYTEVPDPLLDSGKPIRSTDIKQMRDNQNYLNTEIGRASRGAVFDHFNRRTGYSSDLIVAGFVGPTSRTDHAWRYYAGSNAGDEILEGMTGAANWAHYIRGTGEWLFQSIQAFQPNNADLPLDVTFRCRGSALAAGTALFLGLINYVAASTVTPTRGVYLERDTAANWKFSTDDNSTPASSSTFARAANDTWFTVRILYNSTSEVECYFDGTLEHTFTADLPNDGVLHLTAAAIDMGNFDTDYAGMVPSGPVGDFA
jgi:hypothetical protein